MSEQQFLEQVKANQGIIYKLVGLYANDAEEKKDLYQEVLLNAWKGWPNFRGDAKFSTWLYRTCLNTILTLKRKPPILQYKDSLEDIAPSITEKAEQSEKSQRLRLAIRQLSETDRAIISMHLDGFENPEIAAMIGITLNNVGVKLHRIREQLSNLLTQAPWV